MVTSLRCCLFSADRLSLRCRQEAIDYLCHLKLPNVMKFYQRAVQYYSVRFSMHVWFFSDTFEGTCLWKYYFPIFCQMPSSYIFYYLCFHFVGSVRRRDVNLLSSTEPFFLCHPSLLSTCPPPFLPFRSVEGPRPGFVVCTLRCPNIIHETSIVQV